MASLKQLESGKRLRNRSYRLDAASEVPLSWPKSTPHMVPISMVCENKCQLRMEPARAVCGRCTSGGRHFEPRRNRAPSGTVRYLTQGLGHCTACHFGRNILGGTGLNAECAGGLMPDATWYAPSLASAQEAGTQHWPRIDVVKLLKNGVSEHASVSGPMPEVVFSTQDLTHEDLDMRWESDKG